jgi:hypothetical protein
VLQSILLSFFFSFSEERCCREELRLPSALDPGAKAMSILSSLLLQRVLAASTVSTVSTLSTVTLS